MDPVRDPTGCPLQDIQSKGTASQIAPPWSRPGQVSESGRLPFPPSSPRSMWLSPSIEPYSTRNIVMTYPEVSFCSPPDVQSIKAEDDNDDEDVYVFCPVNWDEDDEGEIDDAWEIDDLDDDDIGVDDVDNDTSLPQVRRFNTSESPGPALDERADRPEAAPAAQDEANDLPSAVDSPIAQHSKPAQSSIGKLIQGLSQVANFTLDTAGSVATATIDTTANAVSSIGQHLEDNGAEIGAKLAEAIHQIGATSAIILTDGGSAIVRLANAGQSVGITLVSATASWLARYGPSFAENAATWLADKCRDEELVEVDERKRDRLKRWLRIGSSDKVRAYVVQGGKKTRPESFKSFDLSPAAKGDYTTPTATMSSVTFPKRPTVSEDNAEIQLKKSDGRRRMSWSSLGGKSKDPGQSSRRRSKSRSDKDSKGSNMSEKETNRSRDRSNSSRRRLRRGSSNTPAADDTHPSEDSGAPSDASPFSS